MMTTAAAAALACGDAGGDAEAANGVDGALAKRGRAVYQSHCLACHNHDPNVDGALGPSIAGASPELLEARVLRAEYPLGYTPKRPTANMVALPHLEADLPALAAYLASALDD